MTLAALTIWVVVWWLMATAAVHTSVVVDDKMLPVGDGVAV